MDSEIDCDNKHNSYNHLYYNFLLQNNKSNSSMKSKITLFKVQPQHWSVVKCALRTLRSMWHWKGMRVRQWSDSWGSQLAQAPQGSRLPHRRAAGYGGRPRQPERRKSRCASPAREAAAPGYWVPPPARPTPAPHSAGWRKTDGILIFNKKMYISSGVFRVISSSIDFT